MRELVDIQHHLAFGRHDAVFEAKQAPAVVGLVVINLDEFYGFAVARIAAMALGFGRCGDNSFVMPG